MKFKKFICLLLVLIFLTPSSVLAKYLAKPEDKLLEEVEKYVVREEVHNDKQIILKVVYFDMSKAINNNASKEVDRLH